MNPQKRNNNRRKKNLKSRTKGSFRNKSSENGYIPVRHQLGFPSLIKSKPIFTRVMRYRVATAFTDKAIAINSLFYHMVWTTNASTTAYNVIEAVKLRRVQIFSVPTSNFGGNVNEISFKWVNLGNFGNTITDRGTLTDPAKIVAVPPPHSFIDLAFNVNDTNFTTTFAQINAPVESLIDFHLEFTLLDGAGSSITLNSAATFTGLAFVSPSLGTLIPDGIVNTVTTTST